MWYVKIYPDTMTSPKRKTGFGYGVSSEFDSLNYDICENSLLLEEEHKEGYSLVLKKRLLRLLCFALIGIMTAIIGFVVEVVSEWITLEKFALVKKYFDSSVKENRLYMPFLIWAAANTLLVLAGTVIVTFIEPTCRGSGVPAVMAYLNGIRMPKSFRLKALFVRVTGNVLAYSGGLAVGKEGPMVHAGAIVGAGIAQGQVTVFNRDINFFTCFREDKEKRDFVAAGAAAGITAAFAAPIGGVLFSMESCSSYPDQGLAWQLLFGNLISSFVLNSLLSVYHKQDDLSQQGLLNLGKFHQLKYRIIEIPIFVLIGVIGGLVGAMHNQLQLWMKAVRLKFKFRFILVIEAVFMAIASAAVGFASIYYLNDCKLHEHMDKYHAEPHTKIIVTQVFCKDGEFNSIAAIWFQTPQAMLRFALNEPHEAAGVISLIVFGICFNVLATLTYDISASVGLFIPALVSGAVWGRLVGVMVGRFMFSEMTWTYFGKYAMLGAAAHLSGVLRLTLSLTVIMIETTGNVDMSLPLIVVVIVARWTGDLCNETVYTMYMNVTHIPFLWPDPPPLSTHITAAEVMTTPVVSFKTVETVGNIVDILKVSRHSGFAVTGPLTTDNIKAPGKDRYRGIILRSQLITLLESRQFVATSELEENTKLMSLLTFRYKYPHYTDIEGVPISEADNRREINLVPYMNNSAYTVYETASLPRVFRLFRGLGMRHLVVVNGENNVVGMITRVNLARYRAWSRNCHVGLEEVQVFRKQH